MIENILIEIAVIVGVGLLLSGVASLLKQPLIIGYIAAGIILGPSFLNIVKSTDAIASFAQLGIVVLLFTVGLSLSPKVFRKVGKASLITGIGQILLTSSLGFIISSSLGYSLINSMYIAVALTFSSTIIVMKTLSDKGDGETLYGRISVGLLLVQDVVVMLILAIISSFSSGTAGSSLSLLDLGMITAIIVLLIPLSIYVLPTIMKRVAKSQEYLLLFSLGWCLLLAVIFHELKFSMEIGALLAGVALSMSSYRHEIISKLRPLRDFFIFLFFIYLGSQMVLSNLGNSIVPIIVLSAFIIIGKPVIVYVVMGLLGYTKKNSLLTGLALAQISEFSLILIALGVKLGQLSPEILSLVTIVGLISIAGSSYLMMHSEIIFSRLSRFLPNIGNKQNANIIKSANHNHNEIVIFGYDKVGFSLLNSFKKMGKKYLIIDYNPEVIKYLEAMKINCAYGDAENDDLLYDLCLSKKKMVISTIPVYETNSLILRNIREYSDQTIVILVSNSIEDSLKLYDQGANYVIIPRFLGGEHASKLIEKNEFNIDLFTKAKIAHINHLGDRKSIKHFL
ncbi:MAG TPA: cation:proton antiporter [Candidatus Angelobacter sp.]|nr:cation:proton antiporter [Candidatus Angelobacter sp.]